MDGRGLPAPARSRAPVALGVLVAGVSFAACEAAYGLAWRWNHPSLYYSLVAGLTVAASIGLGALFTLLRVKGTPALALHAAFLASVSHALVGVDPALRSGEMTSFAVAFLGAGLLVSRTPAVAEAPRAFLGAVFGGALTVGLLRGEGLAKLSGADSLPHDAGVAVAGALVFGVCVLVLGELRRRLAPRVAAPWCTAVALLVFLGHAALPVLDRPSGLRRLPPPGYVTGERPESPHVFLLVLDTVRADHLSIYGADRDTTPELDRWVQKRDNVVVYPQAYANGAWTVPSHATLFTGLLPNEHGAHFALDGSVRFLFGLSEDTPTLAEGLAEAGYATLGSFSNNWLRTVVGMGRGFDRYFLAPNFEPLPFAGEKLRQWIVPGLAPEAAKGGARASDVNRTLLSMIEPWSAGPRPLFVFGNYGDAHGPYTPPPGFRGRFHPPSVRERAEHLSLDHTPEELERFEARYDEEILYLDSQLGLFLDELSRRGLMDEAWVFVTSDHGEAFKEHGLLEHGTTVHNEVTRIPLVVFPPRDVRIPQEGGAVSLADVARTIAGIAGFELAGPGRDLRFAPEREHPVAIEFYGDASKAARHGDKARHGASAVVLDGYKLIRWAGEYWLHDLERDPGERFNLYDQMPERAERMKALLPEFRDPNVVERVLGGEDALRAIKGLGYGGS